MKKKLIFNLLLLVCIAPVFAQIINHVPSKYRGDLLYRRHSNLDANNVRTTVHNYGIMGASENVPDQYRFEWPKNTNKQYIYFIQLWMGGEVQDNSGNTIHIVSVPQFRSDPNNTRVSWTNEPVGGFLNPDANSIARSDDPDTWPTGPQGGWADKREDLNDPGWIGSWNGFFGKDIFNADQEMFYRASDDRYHYPDNYTPDETDPTRGGLGILFDARSMAWTQVLINDVQFYVFDILNDGTKRIPKTSFTLWIADLIGNNSQDDEPFLDLLTDITFYTDHDRREAEPWGDDYVGLGSIKMLETPGNQVDGIDNDGDADLHPQLLMEIDSLDVRAPLFTTEGWSRFIGPGDKIVLIDSLTFERHIIEYPAGGGIVKSMGFYYDLPAEGMTVKEDTSFGIDIKDDDLDGLIDEKQSLHLDRYSEALQQYNVPVRYINYLSFNVGDTVKRGFLVAGKGAEFNYSNVAPMIDESRDDGFDNDRDWDVNQNDVGLDGKDSNEDPNIFADTGERDGLPTSGAGTNFPGEANIDKTDVSETDLLGLSGAVQFPAGSVSNWQDDRTMFRRFMMPGVFNLTRMPGESDLWMTSGYFPIEPGERQRIAISVAMAGGGQSISLMADQEDAYDKQDQARFAYEADYRFAKAPLQVTVTAVPGDGKVTLYWDDLAESSIDEFIRLQGGQAQDFEGYRIYRATDRSFLDPKIITDGKGSPLLLSPIAQFDLKDGLKGYHSVPIRGVQYWLGEDNGLKHSFIDTNVTNGQLYYYAVTSYDFGFPFGLIAPSESSIRIDVDPQGNIKKGTNIAIVRPRVPVAGYLSPETTIEHIGGSTTAGITYDIVDARSVKNGHTYEITFEDTVKNLGSVTLVTTKNFSVRDVTPGEERLLIDRSTLLELGAELPMIDGLRLSLFNIPVSDIKLNKSKSVWSSPDIFNYDFSPVSWFDKRGASFPNDYKIIFGETGFGLSKDSSITGGGITFKFPSVETNFKVINTSDNDKSVEYVFYELHGNDGKFTIDPNDANSTDIIWFLEEGPSGKLIYTWQVILNTLPLNGRNPQSGDTLSLSVTKPFQSRDVFRFTTSGEQESKKLAKSNLSKIKVVPNPYIVTESWEPANTFTSGRGPRELHFTHLPAKCTIRIFTVNGELVDKIEFDSGAINSTEQNGFTNGEDTGFNNGTAVWDMLSKDNLEIAYGIYIFHIDAPGIGQRTGTFAIIK